MELGDCCQRQVSFKNWRGCQTKHQSKKDREKVKPHPWQWGYKWERCVFLFSHVQLFGTPCTVIHQAALSMKFSRQEYWSGFPFPSPGDLPNSGIEPGWDKLSRYRREIPGGSLKHYAVCNTRVADRRNLANQVSDIKFLSEISHAFS